MDKIDILIWVIGIGFAFFFGLMIVMWNSINNRLDRTDDKIDFLYTNLSARMDKLDEKLTDVDRRLCRLEGAFASKDCCMIKDERQLKRVDE